MAKPKRFKAPKPNKDTPSTAVATTTPTIEGEPQPPLIGTHVKRSRGRPTKYTPAHATKALNYINNYKSTGRTFPSHQGLCIELGIDEGTLERWSVDAGKPEFYGLSDALRRVQADRLLDGGLSGVLNPVIAKLILAKHGYVPVTATQISGPGGMPIAVVAAHTTQSMTQADIERLYFESLKRVE